MNSDMETLNSWLLARGEATVTDVPDLGYIFPDVGAFFLRKCEGSVGILDSLVTNPDACPVVRNYALDKLYSRLINEAKDIGITRLLGFTINDNTLKRSLRHGFSISPYVTLVRTQES